MEEKKSDECCSSSGSKSSCGCGCGCACAAKKFFVGIIAGVILTAAAFGICMGTKCATGGGKMCPFSSDAQKMCPISQHPTQPMPAAPAQ